MSEALSGPASVLVAGYGPRGRYWHHLLEGSRGFSLAGIVDPDPEARGFVREAGVSAWADIEEALAASPVNAVILATPPQSRADLILRCLDSVDAVLSEKPMCLSLKDASRIAGAAEELGKRVLVCQNFRFLPRESRFAEIRKRIGEPRSASVVSARESSGLSAHMSDVEGAAIWDFCIHHLDAYRIRMGRAPISIYGRMARSGARQLLYAHLEWSDERHVFYQHTEGASRYGYFERVEGERGVCFIDDQAVYLRRRSAPRLFLDRLRRFPPPERRVLDELSSALAGRPSDLDAIDNVWTVAMAEAFQRSIESDEVVRLDGPMPGIATRPDGG